MGYKDPIRQAAYQNMWIQRRRRAWIHAHGPCARCGSSRQLEVHHRNPTQKVTHRVWSWKEERREKELIKCQVVCHACHREAAALAKKPPHGTASRYESKRWRCRCLRCRKAAVAAVTERRRRRRQRERSAVDQLAGPSALNRVVARSNRAGGTGE